MFIKNYEKKAVEYTKDWEFKRNPIYYNFDSNDGDCSSFISQCIIIVNKYSELSSRINFI